MVGTKKRKEENYLKGELYELFKTDDRILDFIQKGSLDGMWYWDLEKPENEWMSPKFWKLFGYKPSEKKHLVSEWQDIIFKEDLKVALKNFKLHCKDENYPYDQLVRYKHKKGHTIWVRCRGLAIRDKAGKAIRMLGAHNDVTELKEAENQLRALNESIEEEVKLRTHELHTFKEAFRGTNDAILLGDVNSNFTYVNQAAARLLGYSSKELIGQNLGFVHSGKELVKDISSALLKHGKFERELVLKKKDGDNFPALLSATRIRDVKGRAITTTIIIKDLSELKKAEELRKRIFLNTSHELKTPITPILIHLDMFANGDLGKLTRDQKKSIDLMLRNVHRLDRLISEILEAARPRKIKMIKSSQDLKKLVDEEIMNFKNVAKIKRVAVINKVPKLEVRCQPRRISQVVAIYLDNALKFTSKGNVVIRAHRKKDSVVVSVEDTGRGIKPLNLLDIFEPFSQVNPSYESRHLGIGLGLSIAKGIITQHKGKVWATSKGEGKGSSFFFSIPI
jgi:PAS domain S-box-containing protein